MDWLESIWTYLAGPLVIAIIAFYSVRFIDQKVGAGKSFYIEWRKSSALNQYYLVWSLKNGDVDVHLYFIVRSVMVVVFMLLSSFVGLSVMLLELRHALTETKLNDLSNVLFGVLLFISGLALMMAMLRLFQLVIIMDRYIGFSSYKAEVERRFNVVLDETTNMEKPAN